MKRPTTTYTEPALQQPVSVQSRKTKATAEDTTASGSSPSKTSQSGASKLGKRAKQKSTSQSLKTPAGATKETSSAFSVRERIEVDVDKMHVLVIKEYQGMIFDVFTKTTIPRFLKPLEGRRVARLILELELL